MEQITETLRGLVELVGPNVYLQAGLIIVLSVAAAKLVDWLLSRAVRAWTKRTKTTFDDKLIDALHRPVFVSVVLIGLSVAADRVGMAEKPLWVTQALLSSIAVWLWLVFALRAASLILALLGRHRERFPIVQPSTTPLLEAIARVALAAGAIYFMMLCWKIDVTAWLASAGIVGLALSFAAQDTLANLFAGMSIIADAPYKVGDFINLDSGERGVVTKIGVRSTRLLTRDDIEVTVPNSVMGNASIINESGGPHEKERIRVQVSAAYGSDVDEIETVLLAVAQSHDELCDDPEPRVRFRRMGDSGLEFELLAWISEPLHRGRLLHLMNGEVYKAFGERGIEIPYPKRDVYIKEMPKPAP